MKKFGNIIRTAFTDAQDKYCEEMSAAEGHSRQDNPKIKVRTDTINAYDQELATSASGNTKIKSNGQRPARLRPTPAMTGLTTLTIPQTTSRTLRHHHQIPHTHPTPSSALTISPSPNTTINPIGYLPTTKPTTCTLCTRAIPIHTHALTHLNFYCAAWFHPACLQNWTKRLKDMNWTPVCPGCKRRVEGVSDTTIPSPSPRPQRDRANHCDGDRDKVSEFEKYLRHLMKDKPVTRPRNNARHKHRYPGGATVDMSLVIERLVMMSSERHGFEVLGIEGRTEDEDEDSSEWEDEKVEESDSD